MIPSKVCVAFPAGGSVTVPFHAALMKLVGYEYRKPLRALMMALEDSAKRGRALTPADTMRLLAQAKKLQDRAPNLAHVSGLYIATNRMDLTEKFLRSDAEWLLQIDTDVEFPEDVVDRMLALAGEDKKILAASVPLGTGIPTTGYRASPEQPGMFDSIQSIPREPVEVDGIATACALIHREVFETIAAAAGRCWWNHLCFPKLDTVPQASGETLSFSGCEYLEVGEDLSFSIRAQRTGFKLWCVHIGGFGHWKTSKLSHDNELAAALAAQDMGVGEIVED